MSNEIVAISTADVTSDMREYDVRELEGGNLAAFCSVKAESMKDKALVFNAANNRALHQQENHAARRVRRNP